MIIKFELTVPFTKSTDNIHRVLPNTAMTNDLYTAAVTEAEVTPVTTRLTTVISLNDKNTLTAKEQEQLSHIGFAVYDDQGRQLTSLSGEGIYEGNQITSERMMLRLPKM